MWLGMVTFLSPLCCHGATQQWVAALRLWACVWMGMEMWLGMVTVWVTVLERVGA